MRQKSRTQMDAGGAPRLAITPPQIVGPFYPVTERPDLAANLARPSGSAAEARGQLLYLTGRVFTCSGEPVPHARIEIWQANAAGRYAHPDDPNPAPLDPNFEGFAIQNTDAEGRYRFKTIKPGAYPTNTPNWVRPPHLHFEVTGKVNRLVTQMYFPGEALNDKDLLLQNLRNNRDGAIAKVLPPTADVEPESRIVVWDIVLDKG